MQKRIIPILITVMAIALVGIVFIQYRWIDHAIDEKQALIDNNVYQAVTEVEQQLNDHRAMAFVSDSSFNNFDLDVGNIEFDDNGNIIREDRIVEDSNMSMQISVISTEDSHTWNENEDHMVTHKFEKHIAGSLDSINVVEIKEGLGQIETVINRIKFEIHSDEDRRLDSTLIANLLNDELEAKGLGEMTNWGIWDNEGATYLVSPTINQTDYDIPMFTSDVVNPGRYDLRLSLDQSNLIWNEIWSMVLMSFIFIVVISLVFAYSIKLVIKHKKISQIKSDFMNNMTHEFKTPLASITLAADSLTHPNTVLTKENVAKYVGIIQEEKIKLNAQVERILEVAALSKDALDIPIEKVNLGDVIDNAIKQFQLLIEQDKVNLNYQSVGDLTVSANAFHLENVLVNLIDNGIKYSDQKPEINIEVDPTKHTIKITDKGIGMDSKQLSKVFDNFYRVQSGNLHTTKGFGLGLSYCKLVIEKMGGEVILQSSPKQGTKAIIQLYKA